ncbi:potassium-transporting ATPase subunit F [Mycobacterium sp. MYCO198283]|nr:potassium-transporting ATPase subunit F [Mycobacterium sp. MYCO198283]MCG5430898.1 potassium-transporting ATPase subunit F [Mycobacterium sp. MYCO198283]
MTPEDVIGLGLVVLLAVYIGAALLSPEKFS